MQIEEYFYTEQQAADILDVNRLTIWRWIKAKKLDAQHIGGKRRGIVLIPKWEINSIKSRKDTKKFEADDNLTLTMAEARLRQAEAELRLAQAGLRQAEAELRQAEAWLRHKSEASQN